MRNGVTFRLQVATDQAQLLAMGARLTAMRRASGLKQQEIADYCNVDKRTYQFWQAGKHPPTGDALPKLVELFRSRGLAYVTEAYILRGPTPEGVASRNGNGASDESQLDRMETKLDILLGLLRGEPPDEQAETERRRTRS